MCSIDIRMADIPAVRAGELVTRAMPRKSTSTAVLRGPIRADSFNHVSYQLSSVSDAFAHQGVGPLIDTPPQCYRAWRPLTSSGDPKVFEDQHGVLSGPLDQSLCSHGGV